MKLHEIGVRHKTDKCDNNHSFMGESYLDIYERYFEALRDKPINLLELGVESGRSLRMWKEFFPKAQIYGVDVNPICTRFEEERITIIIASQDDSVRLNRAAEQAHGFDIVLDDASHINSLTIASFRILFPHVRSDGFYVIEDLGMSHVDLQKAARNPLFMRGELQVNQGRGVSLKQEREDLDRLFRRLLFEMDMLRGELRYLHFWSQIALMKKGT